MLPSGNDAAHCLAENFVFLYNQGSFLVLRIEIKYTINIKNQNNWRWKSLSLCKKSLGFIYKLYEFISWITWLNKYIIRIKYL